MAKMITKHKHTVLSIEDKIIIYECLDKGSSKREIACEYKITVFKPGAHLCVCMCVCVYTGRYLVLKDIAVLLIIDFIKKPGDIRNSPFFHRSSTCANKHTL